MRIAEFASLAGRLLLAAVFLLAGATKFVDPLGLRKALRNFGLPDALARPAVVVLPSLELAVAVALIPASVARYGAWGALVLLTVFLLAVGVAMARGRKPDCHCFGQLHSSPVGWPTLVRNVMLVACAGGLVWSGRRYPQADLWNWLASLNGAGLKFTAIGACIAVFFFFRAVSGARPRSVPVESPPVPIAADDDIPEEPLTPGPERQYAAAPESATVPTRPGPMGIGLPIGTPAPDFELPALNGEKRSLQSLRERGRDLLLVFSSPFCDPCVALASHLVRWKREMEGLPRIVLISRGSAGDNLTKLSGFEPSLVLLQRDSEVSEAYDCNTTPTAVLIDAEGLIRSDLTVGREAIKDLLLTCQKAQIRKRRDRQAPLL